MMLAAVFLWILGSTAPVQQDSRLCINNWRETATTQTELTLCATKEATAVEAELSRNYDKLLAAMAVQEKAYPPVKGVVEKIKVTQAAWVAYRNAFIDATFPSENKQQEYGSSYSQSVSELRLEMAREHMSQLRRLCESSVMAADVPATCGTR